jgi:lipoate synthase
LRYFKIIYDEINLDILSPQQQYIFKTAERSIDIFNKLIDRSEQILNDIKDIKEYRSSLEMIKILETID